MLTSDPKPNAYRKPADCIRSARAGISEVMHSLETAASADALVALLTEAAKQLLEASELLRKNENADDAGIRLEIEGLRSQLKTLSVLLAESERLVSRWIGRLGTRGGYTEQGTSAPLVLVKKVNISG